MLVNWIITFFIIALWNACFKVSDELLVLHWNRHVTRHVESPVDGFSRKRLGTWVLVESLDGCSWARLWPCSHSTDDKHPSALYVWCRLKKIPSSIRATQLWVLQAHHKLLYYFYSHICFASIQSMNLNAPWQSTVTLWPQTLHLYITASRSLFCKSRSPYQRYYHMKRNYLPSTERPVTNCRCC
jgi:hypothetical protein